MRLAPRRLGALVLLTLLVLGFAGAGADAAPRRGPAPLRKATPQGWLVDRVRFEPLNAARPVGIEGHGSYRGAVDVVPSGAALAVVNRVALEDYLLGISEVPVSWPVEAQRAQAIAARTFAAHEIRKPSPAMAAIGADLCDDDRCQVYIGYEKERREGAAAWANAVRTTQGLALVHKGEPILAKYSSTNGGRAIAGGRPYLRAIDDPDDAVSPYHEWHVEIPFADLAAPLGLAGPAFDAQRVGDLVQIEWRAPDGISAGVTELPVAEFRSKLNASLTPSGGLPLAIPSVRFDLVGDIARNVLVVHGRGWGHGVGMSQFGALGKALRGLRAADILAAYYGGLRPVAASLPSVVRVALDTSASRVTVAAEGRFRVVDGSGRHIATVAAGPWRVVPGPRGRVRVLPPPAQAGVPAVTSLVTRPAVPQPGQPVEMRFRVTAPAIVRVSVQRDTGGNETLIAARVVDAGEVVQQLPALRPGGYVVMVRADAGGGRVGSAPVALRVSGSPPAKPQRSPTMLSHVGRVAGGAVEVLAVVLLLGVVGFGWGHPDGGATGLRVQLRALRDRRGA